MPRSSRHADMYWLTFAVATLLLVATAAPVSASQGDQRPARGLFKHIGTFDVMAGNGSAVAEIVDATANGRRLVYTDGDKGEIGFVDISDPRNPKGEGKVSVGGEPTSLVVRGRLVLVAVNTSEGDFVNPSGKLVVVNRINRQIVAEHELGGQPDSIALAPDRARAAIVIENERDEDSNGGLIPQLPTGGLLIVDLRGPAAWWTITAADLSPVAATAFAGDDLEPEYVDINRQNEAVVSFQENNHLAIVDMVTGTTIHHFSAGSVELSNVDTVEEDLIVLSSSIIKRREPDAVAWVDDDLIATANEGDYEDELGDEGGSRGFTIFKQNGTIAYESAESFEHWLVSAGHYNEGRSENKGVEPEAVEVGTYGRGKYLFVGSERANAVGVFAVGNGALKPLQLLPTGIGPEGLKAIPRRQLFVASTEGDESGDGIPTMINIYRMQRGPATYPMIASANDQDGLPIPWVALSGLVGDPWDAETLYAVSDSFLAKGFIYTIDVGTTPATIVDRLEVIPDTHDDLDLEGIAVGPGGYFWLGSEGGDPGTRPNLILKVDPSTGEVVSEIELPAGLVDQRRSNGIEGIAATGVAGAEVVYVAIQRAWPDEGDTDKVNTKIGRYDVGTGEWGFVHYPLEPEGSGGWIGLSELTLLPNGTFAVIERDKGWGPTTEPIAELKSVFQVNLAGAEFRAYDNPTGLVTVEKTLLWNLLSDLEERSVWTAEKLEGLAIAADGQVYAVTDNDGVDDATGETVFFRVGDGYH